MKRAITELPVRGGTGLLFSLGRVGYHDTMRIACPACNATYDVPDTEMRAERVVRCARCGTDWAPVGVVEPPALQPMRFEPAPEPEPELGMPEPVVPEPARKMALDEEWPSPMPEPIAPVVARPRPVLLILAWVVSLLVVGGGIGVLGVQRDRVMAAWPPSIRGYAALGLVARR